MRRPRRSTSCRPAFCSAERRILLTAGWPRQSSSPIAANVLSCARAVSTCSSTSENGILERLASIRRPNRGGSDASPNGMLVPAGLPLGGQCTRSVRQHLHAGGHVDGAEAVDGDEGGEAFGAHVAGAARAGAGEEAERGGHRLPGGVVDLNRAAGGFG